MRIVSYSDLHLEFGAGWRLPRPLAGDVLVLAGDVVVLAECGPLDALLEGWDRPVLYVVGNHELYTRRPMAEEIDRFREWLADRHPNVRLLSDEAVRLGDVQFFGGTMWTDFHGADPLAMETASIRMNDFHLIRTAPGRRLAPADTVAFHRRFVEKLTAWFEEDLAGPRVVITHHAPVVPPATRYRDSPLRPAFNATDVRGLIERFQPDLWVYGHTHECDDHLVGRTRIIANSLGYPTLPGAFECDGFDAGGKPIDVGCR